MVEDERAELTLELARRNIEAAPDGLGAIHFIHRFAVVPEVAVGAVHRNVEAAAALYGAFGDAVGAAQLAQELLGGYFPIGQAGDGEHARFDVLGGGGLFFGRCRWDWGRGAGSGGRGGVALAGGQAKQNGS